jgi:hypothetical protein
LISAAATAAITNNIIEIEKRAAQTRGEHGADCRLARATGTNKSNQRDHGILRARRDACLPNAPRRMKTSSDLEQSTTSNVPATR